MGRNGAVARSERTIVAVGVPVRVHKLFPCNTREIERRDVQHQQCIGDHGARNPRGQRQERETRRAFLERLLSKKFHEPELRPSIRSKPLRVRGGVAADVVRLPAVEEVGGRHQPLLSGLRKREAEVQRSGRDGQDVSAGASRSGASSMQVGHRRAYASSFRNGSDIPLNSQRKIFMPASFSLAAGALPAL